MEHGITVQVKFKSRRALNVMLGTASLTLKSLKDLYTKGLLD